MVFLPGFLVAPHAYGALLAPLTDTGWRVVVPRLYRRGPRAMFGLVTPDDEAARAVVVVESARAPGTPCVLGGHSRGGYAAWLTAARVPVDGLLLVDPVSGGGPPWAGPRPLPPLPPSPPVLVIGAGRGGRCAPDGRNHEQFAAAAPRAEHVVVEDCGHADMLDGFDGRAGRRMCGGATDPVAALERVRALLAGFLRALDPG